jgi:hypothetical protein
MSYFNHAFKKAFLATGPTQTAVPITNPLGGSLGTATTSLGYLTTGGLPTYTLNQLSALTVATYGTAPTATTDGYIGWFNPRTNVSVDINDEEFAPCCNLYLAGSAIYSNDKIGPLAGGYQETNKSKMINPKYVSRFYSSAPCAPQNNVIHVGSTYWTAGGGILTVNAAITGTNTLYAVSATDVVAKPVTTTGTGKGLEISYDTTAGGKIANSSVVILNPGKGYAVGDTVTVPYSTGLPGNAIITILTVTTAHTQTGCGTTSTCCKEFLCGETYSLRVDVKGSPAMRFLNHNAYATIDAYTGCCPDGAIAPTVVDSTGVFIAWANGLINNPIVAPFLQIVVQTELGQLLYAPGTSAAFLTLNKAITWDNYVPTAHTANACAGLIINGAYVDTKFGDCSFQISDFYEKEPVKLYASEVDLNGDPCTFDSLCTVTECQGLQAQGLGETILRDLTLSESYRQNFLATDIRIREITQGNQLVTSINRNLQYYRYLLQHNVPRNYNPSGTFDSDQYLLEIYSLVALTTFNSQTTSWLETCGLCPAETNEYSCSTTCVVPIPFPALPVFNPYNTVSCWGV